MITRTVHVEVTAEDIAAGEPLDCTQCPIALALARACGEDVSIGATVGHLYQRDMCYTRESRPSEFQLPASAIKALSVYDHTGKMRPFAFDVEVLQ